MNAAEFVAMGIGTGMVLQIILDGLNGIWSAFFGIVESV